MKKQLNLSVKAHLLRGAFYLLLLMLMAVCVIPFALGQRATTKQSAVADRRYKYRRLTQTPYKSSARIASRDEGRQHLEKFASV